MSLPDYLRLPPPEKLYEWAGNFVRIVILLFGAVILKRITDFSIRGLRGRFLAIMTRRADATHLEMEKRAATVSEILRKTVAVAIYLGALFMALAMAGYNIGPLLAGAGIAGVAIGFGAQNLVRDVISGFFLLLENQIRIGDVATLNGTTGVVEEINLRTMVLRGNDGTVHVFHNGSINTLANQTRGYAYAVLNIRVAYKEDTDRVSDVLKQIGEELAREDPYRGEILEPLEILGLDQFTDLGVIVQARFNTLPMKQWEVAREMNRRIKKKFDELGIQLR